jgi:plastocyanin
MREAIARIAALASCALVCATGARAADLSVTVRTSAGKPVPDAVVMIRTSAIAAGAADRPDGPFRMAQQHMQFDPFVMVVPVGAEVSFPNLDPVRHHVYSFSPAKTFELKLYAKGETPSVKMDKPGVVALGCNIHDTMIAFIRVVDTPFAGKTDANGVLVLHGLPAGAATLTVWHPYAKAKGNELSTPLTVRDAAASQAVTLDVRPKPDLMAHY